MRSSRTRAEMLEETGELAAAVTAILTGAGSAGVDPRAVLSLRAAIRELDPAGGPPGYQAGRRALAGRLTRALARLRAVPQDLGEVYQLIFECIRSGLPTCARWIEGEGAARLPAREPAVPEVRQSRVQMLCVFSIPDRRVQLGDRHRARTLARPTNPYPTNIPQPKLQAQN